MTTASKGAELYAKIAAEMMVDAGTVDEIAERAGAWRNTVAQCVRTLHFCGLAHVSAWRKPRRGKMVALWKFGAAPDAPCDEPRWEPTGPQRLRTSGAAFAVLIRALHAPTTKEDVAEASGLHVNTIRRVLEVLQFCGAVHIASWERTGRIARPEWRLGSQRNAPRPPRQSHADVARRYRERLKHLDAATPLLHVSAQWAQNAPVSTRGVAA